MMFDNLKELKPITKPVLRLQLVEWLRESAAQCAELSADRHNSERDYLLGKAEAYRAVIDKLEL
jgi:hypothetical protein